MNSWQWSSKPSAGDPEGEFRISPSPTSWLSQSDLWDDDHELVSASTLSSELSPHVNIRYCCTHYNLCMDSILSSASLHHMLSDHNLTGKPACGEAVVYVNLILQAPWLLPSPWIQRPPACFATKCGGGAGNPWGCSGYTCTSQCPWSSTRAGDQMYHDLQQTYIQL